MRVVEVLYNHGADINSKASDAPPNMAARCEITWPTKTWALVLPECNPAPSPVLDTRCGTVRHGEGCVDNYNYLYS